MTGINQWTIVGNVGRDATIGRSRDGLSTFSFSLDVDGPGGDARPLWVSVLAFGRLAEILSRNGLVRMGALALVVGRLEVGRWPAHVVNSTTYRGRSDTDDELPPRLLCIASQVRVLQPPQERAEALQKDYLAREPLGSGNGSRRALANRSRRDASRRGRSGSGVRRRQE